MAVIIGGSNNTILSTTWANKPASYPVGQSIFITDAGTKGSHWFYDGARWKPVNGVAVLASLDSASSSIGNTETVVFQYLIPAALLQTGYRLRFTSMAVKSGTTDVASLAARLGTAGTKSDTAIQAYGSWIAAGSRSASWWGEFRLESATSIMQTTVTFGSGNQAGAFPAVTISSASANALYFSLTIGSAGASDTVVLRDATLSIIAPGN